MTDQHGGNITKIYSTYGLRPDDILDFSANINPLGFPPVIKDEIYSNIKTILHYPDPNCCELRKMLARKYHCNETNIVVGNGSTELFYLIPRSICAKQGFVFQPTFTEFPRALKCAEIVVKEIACNEKDSFQIDLENISGNGLISYQSNLCNRLDSYSNIIFLCNPNNPTGHLIKKEDILGLTQKLQDALSMVKSIHLFEPSVNFILAKITKDELTAAMLHERLIKFGIVIRNCSNFVTLSEKYFRVAVRKRDENIKLKRAIKTVITKYY